MFKNKEQEKELKEKIEKLILESEVKQLNEAVEVTNDKITLTSQASELAEKIYKLIRVEELNNWENRAKLWKSFISKIHLFCLQKDKTDTENLELLFQNLLKAQRENMIKVIEDSWKKYAKARIEGKDAGSEAYKFKEDIIKALKDEI